MDINVSVNEMCIANPDILNSGEAYIHKLKFNFSEEYKPDLVYRACFTCLSGTFVSPILNNECEIPPEALEADGTIELGVYAYILQDETLEKRFSPEHLFLTINAGSYREGLESEAPTPTEQEHWLNAFNQNYLEKMQSANEKIQQLNDISENVEQIEQNIEKMQENVQKSEANAQTSAENAQISAENAENSYQATVNIATNLSMLAFYVDENLKLHVVSESDLVNQKFNLVGNKLEVIYFAN